MARRPSSKKKIDTDIEDLNLVPIMNLVVCLIPMVLYGASFIQIGVVNVNAPKFGMGAATEQQDDDKKPLNLTLAIAEDGFRITANAVIPGITPAVDAEVDAEQAAAPTGPTIPKRGDDYDYVELYNKMLMIKDQFPEESILNLTADSSTEFHYLIRAMDSLRVRLDGSNFNDIATFQAAKIKRDDTTYQAELLWPDVVFAVAQ